MQPHGSQGLSYPSAFSLLGTQVRMTADRMNGIDEESLTESSSGEDQWSAANTFFGQHNLKMKTAPPSIESQYSAKTESSQVHT